jgi:hypothetical protein
MSNTNKEYKVEITVTANCIALIACCLSPEELGEHHEAIAYMRSRSPKMLEPIVKIYNNITTIVAVIPTTT